MSKITENACIPANHHQCPLGGKTMCVSITAAVQRGVIPFKIEHVRLAAHGLPEAHRAMGRIRLDCVYLYAPILHSEQL